MLIEKSENLHILLLLVGGLAIYYSVLYSYHIFKAISVVEIKVCVVPIDPWYLSYIRFQRWHLPLVWQLSLIQKNF